MSIILKSLICIIIGKVIYFGFDWYREKEDIIDSRYETLAIRVSRYASVILFLASFNI